MTDAPDYSKTLFLPQTEFPMRAGLPQKEPELLKHWAKLGLYRRMREAAKDKPRFILHDGPPYANGNIHIGHALNKILKDVVTRSQQMLGYDSNYVPGWDCHGLPIEWKIEEEYRAKGKNKDAVPVVEFRRECRAFAQHWIDVQREEFKRLGVDGDWEQPYTTMDFAAEAQIARELMKFLANGTLYLGSKPVMWSVAEKTALAEAEVEYEEYISDTVWVRFPARHVRGDSLNAHELNWNALVRDHQPSVLIWTTTPWTLPGNRAISFSSKISYGLYEVKDVPMNNWANVGDKFILADPLALEVMRQARVLAYERRASIVPELLSAGMCSHPLMQFDHQYRFAVPLLEGDHVTADVGTGFVHTAPGHGRDDFEVWTAAKNRLIEKNINYNIPSTVDADGRFTWQAFGFEGKRVLTEKGDKGDANEAVIKALIDTGNLVARSRLKHEYPHSWRSKKPLIYRNTPQWFIAMDEPIRDPAFQAGRSLGSRFTQDHAPLGIAAFSPGLWRSEAEVAEGILGDTLRARALAAINATRWVPPQGQNRITGMIESKPDWVISRQRAWGVPITVFVKYRGDGTAELLHDSDVNRRIADAFEHEGADAWYLPGARERFLGPRASEPWVKIDDILDVWFDSGSTHAFTLEVREDLKARRKKDGGDDVVMYLEGSDQHRGWFHSSLIESCGTRGQAPYDVVLTHGFVLDESGHKMSKSLGNVVAPQDVIKQSGADILRMWVCASDYADDLRIGPEILKTTVETYRKLRNTLRWMLGNLAHFRPEDHVEARKMPELERLMLHRLAELDEEIRQYYADFDYKRIFAALNTLMTVDLSAFYFDIRKDALYCDPVSSLTRKACLTVLDRLFHCTVTWLAPMLPFTCEEAWLARDPKATSVHLELFPEVPPHWRNDTLAEKWRKVRTVRRVVTGALELERAQKRIGASLEAAPLVYIADKELFAAIVDVDFAEICITSAATLVEEEGPADAFRLPDVAGVAVVPKLAAGKKCARSWKISPAVGSDAQFPDVTPRDAQALREWEAMRRAAE